ncbi:hypothetical protein, partial [Acaricomes phytoseiuli]
FINWSPNTGAQPSPNGGIRNRWASMGYESGPMGYPRSGEIRSGNNVYQRFQGGEIWWAPNGQTWTR